MESLGTAAARVLDAELATLATFGAIKENYLCHH